MTLFGRSNLENYLSKKWEEKGRLLSGDKRVGVDISDLVSYSSARNAAVDAPFLDMWMLAFDEMLSWLLSLAAVVRLNAAVSSVTNYDRAVAVLTMKVLADGQAIRHLVLAGFDVAACTVLRSTAEYMEVLVAVIHRPDFAEDFVKSDTPADAKNFWEKSLRSGKIRSRVRAAWREFLNEKTDHDAAIWFADWGFRSYENLSAMSHPSMGGGLLSVIPFKSKQTDEKWLGVWGDRSDASVETISIFSSFLFPIVLLGRSFPFAGGEINSCIGIVYNQDEEMHFHVKEGRDIIASMIMSLHSPGNYDYVFPKADLSIFTG